MDASCSARLVQPFVKLVAAQAALTDLVPGDFLSAHPDSRVPLLDAHTMLECGVDRMRDHQLGLRLGTSMSVGSGGIFDYAVRSAPTLGESLRVASRYSRLMTDSFHVTVERRGGALLVRLDDEVSFPRAAADFAMGAIYKLHLREYVPLRHLTCCFAYPAPRDPSEHEATFSGAALRFSAPFSGFVFEPGDDDIPLPGADAFLHDVLRSRLDGALVELAAAGSRRFSATVRRLLQDQIRTGEPSAERTARTLRMSRRTLARRLEQEKTHFIAELDAVRRQVAIEHVQDSRIPLTEVAFLAGFSHVESFHRAFRRWTGQTPLSYRQAALRS